jgi:ubiquitin C-terminal hydrolase
MAAYEKYSDKGLSGLANIGNTCYLNSCMQVLSHCYELNDFLLKGDYKKRLNRLPDSVILIEWDKLRELLWSSNCTVAPYGFVKSIQKVAELKHRDIFTGHDQNDVQEFLLFIIDCFHNALSREVEMMINGQTQNDTDQMATVCYTMMKNMYKKEYSEMLGIFYGIHVSEIISSTTSESLSACPEPFSVLSLSIPNNSASASSTSASSTSVSSTSVSSTSVSSTNTNNNNSISLFDCFDLYCEAESLHGENAWYNDKTKQKEEALRKICFWSLPEVMIIDLKRWHGHSKKIRQRI